MGDQPARNGENPPAQGLDRLPGGVGQLAEAGELLLGPVRSAVERMGKPGTLGRVEILPSRLGRRAETLGALALVLSSTLPTGEPVPVLA